jgi:pimeloyl-ACP methyl ester carboxylesterase
MPTARVNGVELFYELAGSGEPLVLVHGSWSDHHSWDRVSVPLAETFRVLAFDRRGHSKSERPAGQGSVFEDADDLEALIEQLGLAPAHVAGSSFGAVIVLRAAVRHRDVFRSMIVHEPPLFPLLAGSDHDPALAEVQRRIDAVVALVEAGDDEGAARLFAETISLGPAPGTSSSPRTCEPRSPPTRRRFSTRCAIPTPSISTSRPWRASTGRRYSPAGPGAPPSSDPWSTW